MKLDSKLFDSIRVKPDKERAEQGRHPVCDHPGCKRPGTHRAPKGRDREGQMGVNRQAAEGPDGFDARSSMRSNAQRGAEQVRRPRERKLLTLEKRSLDVLNLPYTARGAEIKARYKELVKLNHPDANGGDRSSEDRLREIIQAYNVLKKAGFL